VHFDDLWVALEKEGKRKQENKKLREEKKKKKGKKNKGVGG